MAITYTESWAQSFSDSIDQREVTTTLHVRSTSDVLTSFNYSSATEETSGAAFPRKGDFRAEDTRYRVNRISAPDFDGPRYAKVSVVYRTGPFGGSETEDDPLNEPIRYRFRPVTQSEPTDSDIDGNALLNSAGDPFTSLQQGFLNVYILEATRNEASFDPAFAVTFQNKLNQDTFLIAGKAINAGEARCTGIFPAGEWTLNAAKTPYVPVTYQFEIRERLTLLDGSRLTAHVYRILDAGRNAFIAEGARKVAIYDRNGELPNPTPVTNDVLLDAGQPAAKNGELPSDTYWSIDPDFKPDEGKGWGANPQVAAPPLLKIDKDPAPDSLVTWLYYRRFKETDFSGLNL